MEHQPYENNAQGDRAVSMQRLVAVEWCHREKLSIKKKYSLAMYLKGSSVAST
jgi:hypothetical protein